MGQNEEKLDIRRSHRQLRMKNRIPLKQRNSQNLRPTQTLLLRGTTLLLNFLHPPPSTPGSIAKQSLPEIYPQVLALPIAHRPPLSQFLQSRSRNPAAMAAINETMKRGQPYLGAPPTQRREHRMRHHRRHQLCP
ncbi:hypothetical protein BYT27DRAFT_6485078 [Phlegmacium glaucopus]|nr:hypothetical protein BYT27DRAFT_6485078 [Phlegmacium glaucopus]